MNDDFSGFPPSWCSLSEKNYALSSEDSNKHQNHVTSKHAIENFTTKQIKWIYMYSSANYWEILLSFVGFVVCLRFFLKFFIYKLNNAIVHVSFGDLAEIKIRLINVLLNVSYLFCRSFWISIMSRGDGFVLINSTENYSRMITKIIAVDHKWSNHNDFYSNYSNSSKISPLDE